jgi:intracellular multiplication protein IcmD
VNKHHVKTTKKGMVRLASFTALACVTGAALASSSLTLGGMASSITGSFTSLTKLVTAGAYIAGLAFAIGAVMTFKQHKDNPTNIPIGKPVALTLVAAALLFFPTILGVTGSTMFSGSGTTSGPTGSVFSS